MTRASVRRSVRIARPAGEVWEAVGDPARVQDWFTGIESSAVEGDTRTVTLGSGLPLPEQIVTLDPVARRFQYRITSPMVREHLSTLDVIDLDDGTTLAVYACDADPATMALIIGGAAGSALESLKERLESGHRPPGGPA